jgi:hypothetical protein
MPTTQVKSREYWDCHKHRKDLRVSDACTVYHPDKGQLSYWEVHYDCTLYYPIQFIDKAAAHKWIENGTIAEIQEGMSCLRVGFTCKAFGWRGDK